MTDIALPDLSGVRVVRAVRQTRPDLKVRYVTGYSGLADPDHAPGPDQYFESQLR